MISSVDFHSSQHKLIRRRYRPSNCVDRTFIFKSLHSKNVRGLPFNEGKGEHAENAENTKSNVVTENTETATTTTTTNNNDDASNPSYIPFTSILPTHFHKDSNILNSFISTKISTFEEILYIMTELCSYSAQTIFSYIGITDHIQDSIFSPIYRHEYFARILSQPISSSSSSPIITTETSTFSSLLPTPLYKCRPEINYKNIQQYSTENNISPYGIISSLQFAIEESPQYHITDQQTIHVNDFCSAIGGECQPIIDGYFLQVIVQAGIGYLYLLALWPILRTFDKLPIASWHSNKIK